VSSFIILIETFENEEMLTSDDYTAPPSQAAGSAESIFKMEVAASA